MGGWRLVKHYSDDVAHVRRTYLRRYKCPQTTAGLGGGQKGGTQTIPLHSITPTPDLIVGGTQPSTNSSVRVFLQEDASPFDEEVDQRSRQGRHVTRPQKRAYAHRRPHQGHSSSYIAGRPQHLALGEGPMSQDRLSNLFPNRATEEVVPPTPTVVTMPQITAAPSAPHQGLQTGDSPH
ncbi:hypothetical protein BHE74_00025722 [Ensete ventricosum]|nr:hypothetical protein BHE74_00025722 [Ensete ventricosum]